MSSCENSTVIHEPVVEPPTCLEILGEPVSEQQSCMEEAHTSFDSMVGPKDEPDLYGPTINDTSVKGIGDTVAMGDGLVVDSESINVRILGETFENNCGISEACLNENQGDICNSEDGNVSVEEGGSQGENNLVSLLDGCEMNLEVTATSDSLSNCAQPDEQNKDMDIDLVAEHVKDLLEVECNISAGMETSNGDLISPLHGCEMICNYSSVDCLPIQCSQKDGMEKNVCDLSSGVIEEKAGSAAEIVAEILPSVGDHKPSPVARIGNQVIDCNHDSVQKYEESISSFTAERVIEVSDVKTSPDTSMQVASPQCCQSSIEEIQLDDSLAICAKLNGMLDDATVSRPSVEIIAHPIEENITSTGNQVTECNHDSDQKDEETVISFSAERFIEVSDVKNNLYAGMRVVSPQCCQISMEEIQLDDSLAICAQQNGMHDDKTVSGSLVEITVEPMEGSGNSTSDTKVNIGKSTLLVEENSCNLKDGSSAGAPNCIAEKFASLLSCQPFDVASGSSSKIVDATNIYRNDDGLINSSSTAYFTGQTDDNLKDPRVCVVSETKCPETVASSTGRSGQQSKPRKKILNKRAARKSKASKVLPPHVNVEIILDGARRKRSCVSKPARSSLWGSSACEIQFFEQSNMHGISQIQTPGSRKTRDGRGSGKRNGNKASARARGSMKESRGKSSASTSQIHLKVKFGKGVDENCLNILAPGDADTKFSANAVSSSYGTESYSKTNLELLKLTNSLEVKRSEDGTVRELNCFSRTPVTEKAHIAASDSNDHPTNNDSYSTVMIEKSTEEHLDNYYRTCTEASEPLERASVTGCLDPGTSPDSEVINPVSDAQVGGSYQELQNSALISAQDFVAPGKKIDKQKEKFSFPNSRNRAKSSKEHGSGDEFLPTDIGIGFSESKTLKSCLPVEAARQKPSKSPKSSKSSKGRSKASEPGKRGGNTHRQMENQHKSVTERKAKEDGVSDSVMSTADNAEIGHSIVDIMGKTISGDDIASIESPNLNVVQGFSSDQSVQPRNAWVLCDDCQKWRRIPASLVDCIGQENCTWTCKENLDKAFADCSIPQEKSNAEINMELEISDGSGDEDASNSRRSFRKLEYQRPTVSQEHAFKRIDTNQFLHRSRKTQTIDEIMVCHCKPHQDGQLGCGEECLNRMLNIECVRGTCPCGDHCSNQQFQKRKYAKLEWFRSGKKGYGLQSTVDISQGQFLIEYVGEVLDMHSYEARQKEYALNGHRHFYFMTLNGSEVIDACAKGNLGRFINHSCMPNCRTEKWMVNGEICIGLFALRNIKKGEEVTFDYNYVRVFGAAAKKCYCGSSQCRGYIGGDPQDSEVIVQSDSDEEFPEPVILGENGKMGHSKSKRATISDHVEMHTVGSITEAKDKIDQSITAIRQLDIKAEREDPSNQSSSTLTQLHSSLEFEDSKAKESSFIQPHESFQQTEDVTSKPMTFVEQDISTLEATSEKRLYSGERVGSSCPPVLDETLTNGTDSDRKSKSDTIEDKQVCSKKFPRVKTSCIEGSYRKVKVDSNSLNVKKFKVASIKSHTLSIKPKKLMEGTPSRFEAVEGKLNELLDAEGGISKRKDAPKGYLKLLLLTAASGDSGNSEAIQSNRDLSMILDAILKTKSRVVLIDIISKNGLQMLHKMMKQYRRDFKKIPILRKLLKVFEYMAVKEILTSEQITEGPPYPGMESFRESILSLTEHNDKQVHQIARKFRDRWIPRPLRKIGDGRMDIHRPPNCSRFTAQKSHQHEQDIKPTEAIDLLKQSMPPTLAVDPPIPGSSSEAQTSGDKNNGTTIRKRKSRWDQPADPNKALKVESSGQVMLELVNKVKREETSSSFSSLYMQQGEAMMIDNREQNIHDDGPPGFSSIPEDAPPGFSCPLISHPVSANASTTTTSIGYLQERFISRLPVSYGIPLSTVQQFGIPEHENSETWTIAPGIPFHPFPPLPPYPLGKKTHPYCDSIINQSLEEGKRDSIETHLCNYSDDTSPSTSADQSDMNTSSASNHDILKSLKELSTDLGKRYFRQQRRNSPKAGPPWKRNLWGHPYSRSNGNVANENRSSCCEDKVSYKGDNPGSDIYHHTQNQNQK